jgi:hypothetical protein
VGHRSLLNAPHSEWCRLNTNLSSCTTIFPWEDNPVDYIIGMEPSQDCCIFADFPLVHVGWYSQTWSPWNPAELAMQSLEPSSSHWPP